MHLKSLKINSTKVNQKIMTTCTRIKDLMKGTGPKRAFKVRKTAILTSSRKISRLSLVKLST